MDRFVALLRGINVGRGNRVPMAELRGLLCALGYRHVSTLLNSGNAVFAAPAQAAVDVEQAIAGALTQALGVSVPVIAKSAPEFDRILAGNPTPSVADASRLLVVFASRQDALEPLAALEPLLLPSEALSITPQAAYLHCAAGILESKAAAALLGKLGRGVTTRNWATVLKIASALRDVPSG